MLRRGEAAAIIPALAEQCGAVAVHAGQMVEPWARAQDAAVRAALPEGVPLHLHRAGLLFDPGTVRTKTGGAFSVYTPVLPGRPVAGGDTPPPEPAPKRLTGVAAASDTLDSWRLLPAKPDWAGGLRETWQPGEAGAHARAERFMAGKLAGYEAGRNTPGADLTSMLSPHLHWGELSPAQLWHAAVARGPSEGLDRYLFELLWHEFSANLLWEVPTLPDTSQRSDFARFPLAERPTRPARLAARADRRAGRGRRDAAALAHRLDAQPRADDRRLLPGEAPAGVLGGGRAVVLGHAGGWRPGGERAVLAVGRRHGHGQPAVLPRVQPADAG